jgi:hypothetical protein
MTYDVSRFLDSLKNTLVSNATTLSASLTVNYPTITTDSILIGNPTRLTRQVDQYPAIILNPKSTVQPFDEIGMTSSRTSREVTVNVDILCLTQCASDGEDADKQCRILARNVQNVLESNLENAASTSTVSDGWHLCMVENSVYDGAYTEKEQTYQSAVRLETTFKSWAIS